MQKILAVLGLIALWGAGVVATVSNLVSPP
jgi:hypothetical protein